MRDVLRAAGLEVHVLDPARVRHFAKAKGRRAKTDPIDARLIAEFTATLIDTPPMPVDPAREDLARVIRARRLLVATRADMTKAAKGLPDAARDRQDSGGSGPHHCSRNRLAEGVMSRCARKGGFEYRRCS